ncbi:MAG: sigma-70 family RNA polymerase sigma factor [Muribaculaceae bacterium]|nr:sigma-70 family RNA polymerase sigma factor [Muribaculaceae bacterium]
MNAIKNCALSDAELVREYIHKGDNNAFDKLVDRHSKRVLNHILYTVKDEELANDLFQDTFMKVVILLRNGKYNEEGRFQGWLMRVTANIIMDHFRKKQASEEASVSTDNAEIDILNRLELSDPPLEDILIEEQVRQNAVKLMNALPENQREILELRFYQDLSFKEIAEMKGMSINTALGRMHYAVNNMRRLAQKHALCK